MPYYRFMIDDGASDDEVIHAVDLRTAWKQLPDRFEDEELHEIIVSFAHEVEMPAGFEEGESPSGEEEGTRY